MTKIKILRWTDMETLFEKEAPPEIEAEAETKKLGWAAKEAVRLKKA